MRRSFIENILFWLAAGNIILGVVFDSWPNVLVGVIVFLAWTYPE